MKNFCYNWNYTIFLICLADCRFLRKLLAHKSVKYVLSKIKNLVHLMQSLYNNDGVVSIEHTFSLLLINVYNLQYTNLLLNFNLFNNLKELLLINVSEKFSNACKSAFVFFLLTVFWDVFYCICVLKLILIISIVWNSFCDVLTICLLTVLCLIMVIL